MKRVITFLQKIWRTISTPPSWWPGSDWLEENKRMHQLIRDAIDTLKANIERSENERR